VRRLNCGIDPEHSSVGNAIVQNATVQAADISFVIDQNVVGWNGQVHRQKIAQGNETLVVRL
jgi:hypothetical protein